MVWDPALYGGFSDLRLRPAMDLLAAVEELPPGAIEDLGCGAGAVAPVLAARFPDRPIYGIENSEAMATAARALNLYAEVSDADIATHAPGTDTALLFANASFNWVPDHRTLLPRLVQALTPGGWLAVQMPDQHDAPSHALAREIAHRLDPDAFPDSLARPHVLTPCTYADLLEPLGEARIWRTEYLQRLGPVEEGHPVRRFTQSTYLRPYLDHFMARGQGAEFLSAYDAALQTAYPLDEKGLVWFPFKRLFLTLCKA